MNPFIEIMTKTACSSACSTEVKVKENSDNTCTIEDVMPIDTSGANGARSILWTIAADSPYKFSDESYKFGLFVKVDPQGKFKSAKVKDHGKTLELDFEHRRIQGEPQIIYDYALTVRRDNNTSTNGTFCVTKDPWIIS